MIQRNVKYVDISLKVINLPRGTTTALIPLLRDAIMINVLTIMSK